MTLTTVWLFGKGAVYIEALWDEIQGLLPLIRVVMDGLDSDVERIAIVHINTTNFDVLVDASSGRILSGRFNSHAFHVAHLGVVEIFNVFQIHLAHDVVFDSVHEGVHLFSELLVAFRVEKE